MEGTGGRGARQRHQLRLQLVGHQLDGGARIGQRAAQVKQVDAGLQQGEPAPLPLNLRKCW